MTVLPASGFGGGLTWAGVLLTVIHGGKQMKLLNEILGTKYPIIQGGMANIATGEFAAACSNAGALGIIGAGGVRNADDPARTTSAAAGQLTDKPFGVNIMLMHPCADEFAQVVAEEHVRRGHHRGGQPRQVCCQSGRKPASSVIPVVAAAVLAKHLAKSRGRRASSPRAPRAAAMWAR